MVGKTLKEAGNYAGLSPEETSQLSALSSPELRSTLGGVVTNLRRRNKQVDLRTAASQLLQTPQLQGNAELASFVNTPNALSTDPSKVSSALSTQSAGKAPLPSNFGRSAPPQRQNTPVPLPSNFPQRQSQPAGSTGPKSFDQQLADRKLKQTREQQPSMREAKTLKEFLGQGPNIQKVLQSIRTLNPEELGMLRKTLDSLMGPGQRQRAGQPGGMMGEHKKLISEAMLVQINEQVAIQKKLNHLLSERTEGGVGSIWDKMKSAGTAIGQKMGLVGQVGQQANDVAKQETQVAQELQKMVAKVNQHRQKFNSSILKNSQTLDQYHNLVSGLVDAYKQNQHAVGAAGPQISRQIQDAVGNFVYDLKSEKEQIDLFLKQLQDAGAAKIGGSALMKKGASEEGGLDPKALGAAAQKKAQAARLEENPSGGVTSARRNVPGGHLGPEDLDATKQSILAKAAQPGYDKQRAMKDLEALFLRQINQDKKKPKAKSKPKKK